MTGETHERKTVALALAAISASFGGQAAQARQDRGTVMRNFTYSDLDLATRQGADAARLRAREAVERMCETAVTSDNGSYDYKIAAMRCRQGASAQAEAHLAKLIAAAPVRKLRIIGGTTGAELALAGHR